MVTIQLVVIFSVICVAVVNGWTDAPNAITSVVCSGALRYRSAVGLAVVFNLIGAAAAGLLLPGVTQTMGEIADFGTDNPYLAMIGVSCALLTVALWGTAAWVLGIPTSESHALIAAVAGVSAAIGGFDLRSAAWLRVGVGLVLSIALGWLGGRWFWRLLAGAAGRLGKGQSRGLQIAAAGGMALLHGAQDGQKFAAMLLAAGAAKGGSPFGAVLLCSAAIALGTSIGGRRIIERVGQQMVQLDAVSGICSDMGAAVSLLVSTLLGLPVSTSHVKVSAVAGVGGAQGKGRLNLRSFGGIVAAWLLTFPACFAAAYLAVRWITN